MTFKSRPRPFLPVGPKDRAQVSGLAQASFPALEADLSCMQSHFDEMKIFMADRGSSCFNNMAVCVCRSAHQQGSKIGPERRLSWLNA